jgi:pyrroloquinoline quinone (PQQ) biosynthesis protein C
MAFFEQLQLESENGRKQLLSAPIINASLNGNITLDQYYNFLLQAYHHVKHTTPLLMAAGARIQEDKEWLRAAIAEYIEEELGHQEWILNDIAACGFDKEQARNSKPKSATELMVAYAYDTINRINPLGFFGMVHVLEGTSIAIADQAASAIQKTLQLPDAAFSYLRSHGALDIEHVKFFEGLMNRIEDEQEQALIIHSATMFYQLYGDIFRSISVTQTPVQLTKELCHDSQ